MTCPLALTCACALTCVFALTCAFALTCRLTLTGPLTLTGSLELADPFVPVVLLVPGLLDLDAVLRLDLSKLIHVDLAPVSVSVSVVVPVVTGSLTLWTLISVGVVGAADALMPGTAAWADLGGVPP